MKKILTLLVVLVVGVSYGQKEKTVTLNKDTKLIDVIYYHDNGTISQTGSYTLDGKLQGEWLSYNNQGEKLVQAYYNVGMKVGKWFYWNEDTLKEVDYRGNAVARINEWSDKKTRVAVRDK